MKLSNSYNHDFKGVNTEMLITVKYDNVMREVESIESIQIMVNCRIVADITNIIHDFFDEIEDKIYEDQRWDELADEAIYEKSEMYQNEL